MATKSALVLSLVVVGSVLVVALLVVASGDEPDPTSEASAATSTSTTSTSSTSISTTTSTSGTTSSSAETTNSSNDSTSTSTGASTTTAAPGTDATEPDPAPNCSGELPINPPEEDGYRRTELCGWPVLVNNDLFDNPLVAEVYRELALDMQMVLEVVPASTLQDIQDTNIWLELDESAFPGGVYHPSAQWLEENGHPTKWAQGIQFGIAQNYLDWPTQQPAMLLHELTHALHDQQFGTDQPDVLDAYDQAMAAGLYDSVEYVTGGELEAYAATNHHEYLAELTEAYFWTNDFYPFDRQDLAAHDPVGLLLVEQIWGVN